MRRKSGSPERRRTAARPASREGVKYLLLAAAAALIALGVWTGEPAEVLRKAATICLECIGVG